jgi:ribosomal-protein-alanine N-acetyltransferase
MNEHERIHTLRLVLRRPRPEDAEAIFNRYGKDPEVTRWVSFPTHKSVEDARQFIALSDADWAKWPAGPYLIESREDGALLGGTGLDFETPRRASTGYVLAKDAWGRGYATEALEAMVRVARATGVERLWAICHVDHKASAHVLEKCDFSRAGTLRRYIEFPNFAPGKLADVLCYARSLGEEVRPPSPSIAPGPTPPRR